MGNGVNLFKTLFADEYYPYTANTLMSAKPTSKVIKDSNNQTVATIVYSGNELRGLLKVGTDGLYADGDIDDGSGSTQVRYGIVDLGSLDYVYSDSGFSTQLPNDAKELSSNAEVLNCISDMYEVMSWNDATYNKQSGTMGTGVLRYIVIYNSDYSDTVAFKAAMSGKYLVYELATPTTAVSTAWSNPIIAKEGGAEEFIDGNEFSIVDLGSLDWNYDSGLQRFVSDTAISDIGGEMYEINFYKNAFIDGYTNATSTADKTFFILNNKHIYIYDSSYSDSMAFKNAMSGVYLIYENSNSVGFQMFSGHDTIYGTDMTYHKDTFTQIYGGDYEAVSGVLTSRYNSDGSTKTTPDVIQKTPETIMANAGANNIWNDAGNSEVKYIDMKGEGT